MVGFLGLEYYVEFFVLVYWEFILVVCYFIEIICEMKCVVIDVELDVGSWVNIGYVLVEKNFFFVWMDEG